MTILDTTHLSVSSQSLNRRRLLIQAAVAGLAIPAFTTFASPRIGLAAPARAADPLAAKLDAMLDAAVAGGFPGIVMQVERAGKTMYSGAAGISSIEQKTPIKVTDRARIYSIAKSFTALVTLQLVDEGVLSLDDTATKWLDDPAVAAIPNADEATLQQLLNHTSGIYDFADDRDSPFWADAFLGPEADWTKVWTMDELLAYADGAKHGPYFAPGEDYFYSNTNYILIGLMIEEATGHSYGSELRSRILEPLALKDTFFAEGAEMPEDTIDAYQLVEGQLVSLSGTNLSWAWTFGGMVSTTADLARFARAFYGGDLVSPESFAAMFDVFPAKHEGYYEGIGLYKIDTPNGALIGMDGTGPGANSFMMRHEEADITVLLINNMAPDEGATEFLRDDVFKVLLASASCSVR